MRENELESENHRIHAFEWRSDDTCLLCLIEIIQADSRTNLRIHRRFALATLNHRLNPDVIRPSLQEKGSSNHKNLAKLLQKNRNVSTQVLDTLLGSLTLTDVVDLAIEAVYRLYRHVLRDELVLDQVLTHCIQKIGQSLDQPEKWVPYLSVMQRLAHLNPSAIALAINQNAKLKNEMVEHLSDHLTEFVALHVIALLDPIVRNDADEIFIRPSRRPILMLQLARLLETAQCQQLICAVLGFALMLWIKEDLQQLGHQQDNSGMPKIQQLLLTTANGLKRIVLQSQPDIQVAALQVLDAVLLQCRQLTDGTRMMAILMEQQDVAELIYDVLYSNHLPLLEFALRCLHHLSRCPLFFQHRCVILGVEPLLRVIPHLASSNASALIVAYAVHLLSDMLSKYDGEESLLQRCVSTDRLNGGFSAACQIACMALNSCAVHLETGGACLLAALLDKKNLPVPIPVERVAELIRSCLNSLAPPEKKWRCETGRIHLQGLIQMFSSAISLIVYLTDDPCARLSSYASTNSDQAASHRQSFDKLIDLIVTSIDQLITAFQQIDEDSLWSDLFLLLVQLASSSDAGAIYVQDVLKAGFMLKRCWTLRGSVKEAADDLLTWFLVRSLIGNVNPAPASMRATLRGLVRSIPSSVAELGGWISRDKSCPFGAKCTALILLYQLELYATSKDDIDVNPLPNRDVRFVGEHSDAILAAIADLMLTHSPCDMDDPDLLRSIWFLIARYSDGFHEASKAFVHLVKWFQPNGSLLLAWLQRIYTPHLSLMRWAFALDDIALYLGSYMIRLWIDQDEDARQAESLVELCLERTDDVLLLSVFDLAFHEDANVSCCAVTVLERVADRNEAMRVAIGRMIKYNIPRFLRLTDVTDDNYTRLIGSLRLLCRLSSWNHQCSGPADAVVLRDSISAWKDPAIIAALVSFLPRTIQFVNVFVFFYTQLLLGDLIANIRLELYPPRKSILGSSSSIMSALFVFGLKLGAMELWSWSCRYLTSVLTRTETASSRVLSQIVMEKRNFLEFVDDMYRRDELPVWKDVVQLVAAMAAFHHLHCTKVISPIRVSMGRLSRKLTAGLVGIDADETIDAILQLLEWLLVDSKSRLVIDPDDDSRTMQQHCCGTSRERSVLLEHLWAVLVNWTVRAGDASPTSNRIFACLTQLMRSCQQSLPAARFALLASQPWNYRLVDDAIRCPSGASDQALELATALIHHSKTTMKSCGAHPWSSQLEETLSRHAPSQ
ncbi:hypothetical protein GHT06_014670 [Daphnia sinensis]|uniref:Uncharacterized protein n=1 Tax=Daphnia sinensis TaxID=1820382 RepID=A0AAD5L901_9CRUS|nr:hypothetical protein GHT06_014670 [Daphnia sinensis]